MVQTIKREFMAFYAMLPFILAFLIFLATPAYSQSLPSCTLTANPASGTGQFSTTLTWSTQNCAQALASGAWSGPKDCAGGTTSVSVNSTRNFILTVSGPTGPFKLSWTKPTTNTDGTPTTIVGYKLYIATTPEGVETAPNTSYPATTQTATFYFPPGARSGGVKSVRNVTPTDSNMSNIVTKTVKASTDSCQATVTVTSLPRAPILSQLWERLKRLIS